MTVLRDLLTIQATYYSGGQFMYDNSLTYSFSLLWLWCEAAGPTFLPSMTAGQWRTWHYWQRKTMLAMALSNV